jgi:hypothetical protein
MEKGKKDSIESSNTRIGPWHMLRDVLGWSMAYGQFVTALMALIIIVGILRLSPSDLAALTRKIIGSFQNEFYGHFFNAFLMVGWVVHVRALKSLHEQQIQRITSEKLDWHKLAIDLISSKTNTDRNDI